MSGEAKTHFGFRQVPVGEKQAKVGAVFDSVARRYDTMNDLMSFGVHRMWKRFTIAKSGVRRGDSVLDIAGGTGDLSRKFADIVGPDGRVVLADINASMLAVGRERLLNEGYAAPLEYVQANAESLPFPDDSFNCVSIAFGLRNVTDKDKALADMCRVLKPGGRLLVLEFSKPKNPLMAKIYDTYSFKALPLMGKFVARDSESYQYLAESIRMHPDQEIMLGMLQTAGFSLCKYYNLTDGVVALHTGIKA